MRVWKLKADPGTREKHAVLLEKDRSSRVEPGILTIPSGSPLA